MITANAFTLALATIALGTAYLAAFVLVQRVRSRPAALAAPIALAVLFCFEAVVLQALSLAHAVTRTGVLLAHTLPFVGAALVAPRATRDALRAATRAPLRVARGLGRPALLVVPLLALVTVSAARYAPTNWDSMTYHLARVAHWIQRASVEPYPTNIARQVTLGPGAEYVLLVLQVISGSDRLAAVLQLSCYVLLVVSAPWLARLAGARKGPSRWAAVLAAGLPMAILQASSTQNDLVSGVLAVAIVIACMPFLHRSARRWTGADVLLLGATGAAAAIVKPVAVICALPFVALAAWCVARSGRAGVWRRDVAVGLVAALALVTVVAGPALAAQRRFAESDDSAMFVFPLAGEWTSRSLNVVRGLAHHLPASRPAAEALELDVEAMCGDAGVCTATVLRPHEDYAGNPVHALVVLLLVAIVAARFGALGALARMSTLAVVASWIVFHLVFRDNAWLSRLQTPLFAVSFAALAALGGAARDGLARSARLALPAFALVALSYGYSVAVRNESRPPLSSPDWLEVEHWSYYQGRSSLIPQHDYALAVAEQLGCRRLGLFLGGDGYDYPLTWRAMQRGIEVRHVVAADAWPCLVFTDRGAPPSSVETTTWLPSGSPMLVVNARAFGR